MNAINIIIRASDMASSVIKGVEKSTDGLKASFLTSVAASQKAAMGLAAVGVAAGGLIGFGAKISGDLEAARMGFVTLLGSTKEADKVLALIKKDAASTPFEIRGLIQANQLLTSVTNDGVRSEKMLMNVGKALAAMGRGQPELDRIIINLQQIAQSGKANEIDMKQFAYAGVNAYQLVADSMGITAKEARKLQDDGLMTFEILEEAFNKAGTGSGKFAKAFENQAGTFNQLVANMKDSIMITADEIMRTSGIFDYLKSRIASFIGFMTEHKDEMVDGIKAFINFVKDNAPAVVGVLTGALAPALIGVAFAVSKVLLTLTPWSTIFALVAIGANYLAEKMGGWDVVLKKVRDTIEGMIKWYKSLSDGQQDIINVLLVAIPIIYSAVKAYGAAKMVITALTPKYTAAVGAVKSFTTAVQVSTAWALKSVPGLRGLAAMVFHTRREYLMATGQIQRYTFFKKQYILTSNIARVATQKLALALKFMISPVGLVILAVVAFIAIMVLLYKKNEDFRNFIDKAWTAIKNAVVSAWNDYIFPALVAIGEYITGTLVPIFIRLGQIVKSAWDSFVEFYAWVWPPVKAALIALGNAIMKDLWPALQELGKAFGEVWKVLVDGGKEIWKALQPAFQEIGTLIKDVLIPALQEMWKVFSKDIWPVLQSIGNTIMKNLWPALKNLASTLIDALKPAFEALMDAGKSILKTLKDLWKELAPKLWPILKVIGYVIGAIVVVAFIALITAIKVAVKILAVMVKIFAAVVRVAAPVISFVFKAIAFYITNILIPYIKLLVAYWTMVFNVIATVLTWAWNTVIKPIWDLLYWYITNVLIPVWKKIWEAAQLVWNGIVAVITWAWNNVIKPVWDLLWAYITNVLIPVWKTIFNVAKQVWDGVWAAVTAAWAFIQPIWQAIWDFITLKLVPVLKQIWTTASDVFTKAWGKIKEFAEKAKEWFDKVKETITSAINKVKEIKNKIVDVFDDAKDWLYEKGKQIVQGLIDGAKSIFSKLGNLGKDMGKKIKDGLGSIMSFGSPSKLMKKYGRWTGQGLVIGMQQTQAALSSSAANMGKAIVGGLDGINKAMPSAGSFNVSTSNSTSPPPWDGGRPPGDDGSGGGGLIVYGDVILNSAEAVDRFLEKADRQAELSSMGVPV